MMTNSRNLLKLDPTRTGLIRKAFARHIQQAWIRLRNEVRALVEDGDAFGLVTNAALAPCSRAAWVALFQV